MPKRSHRREFKLEMVRQITTGQKWPAQICHEYGLADSVVYRWLKEYRRRGEAAFSPKSSEPTMQEQRIRELERFCGQQAMEIQALKTALQGWGGVSHHD